MEITPIFSKLRLCLRQGLVTAGVCAKQMFEGGIWKSAAENLVRLVQFVLFVLLWKGFASAGVDLGGFTLPSLLTYTLLSFALRRQLNILSPATSMLWEGSVIGRYARPMPIYLTYISETIGRWWVPYFLLFTLPLLLVSPLLGIYPLPASAARGALFFLSLLLSIILGFGIDLLFSALALKIKNAVWIAVRIREAVYNLLSGALIPFALFPPGAARVFALLPFGSVASPPLSIYVGQGNPAQLLALQAFWAVVIWAVAHRFYKKSEEGMVSYGG